MNKGAHLKRSRIETLRTMPRCDIGNVSVFTDRPITVGLPVYDKVTTHREHRTKAFGYVMVGGRSVWWMRYGLAVQLFGR